MPLPPVVSALAKQTIQAAYVELECTFAPADKRDIPNTTLQDVRKAALKIEDQLGARQSLRNMRRLMPLFQGLEHYAKVVDVLCNGTPYLPWIWAPITLILRVASEYVEAFEQIIEAYSDIAESLKRFEILSDAFIREPEFQKTLAIFYADILHFHKHAYKFVHRRGWKLIFSTSWGRFERRFRNILEDLRKHGSLIDQEANARNIAGSIQMREDVRKWREKSQNQVRREEVEENARQYEAITSWLKINESDQLAIFDSKSSEATDYQGTCGWILSNSKIRSWTQNRPDIPTLWLKGSAGTGKSVLCTQLVNFMKTSNLFVIHHFCTYQYASSTTYEQILRSLLLQLFQKDDDLVAHVYQTYVLAKKSATNLALENLLQRLLSSISGDPTQTKYLWIIVDGLDECEQDKQMRLIRLINQMTSNTSLSGAICKALISSRAPSDSLQSLQQRQIISLTEEKDCLHEAIKQYVGQRLRSLDTRFRQLEIEQVEIDDIQTTIVAKADGMFLYARLVVDHIINSILYSYDEIKAELNILPKKLTDFYQKILTQMLAPLDTRSVDRIMCILNWIAFAKRPLQKFEFLSAITFSPGNPEVARLAPQYILDICGALIDERRDSTLTFIHISVKEFLQTPSSSLVIHEKQALREHGVASIMCLLAGLRAFGRRDPEQDTYLRVAKGIHGFHIYATEYWTDYLLSHAASTEGLEIGPPPCLLTLACQLANELENLLPSTLEEIDSETIPTDERLQFLQKHTLLHKHLDKALKARSLKVLESRILGTIASGGSRHQLDLVFASEGISAVLDSYQEVVRSLLAQAHWPNLSADELELFRVHFRTAAFTCRLSACPRATLGFESAALCSDHEISHVRLFRCSFLGCQSSPFASARALKNHTIKTHTPTTARKSIRRAITEPHENSYEPPEHMASPGLDIKPIRSSQPGPRVLDDQPGAQRPLFNEMQLAQLRVSAGKGDTAHIGQLHFSGANLDDPQALCMAAAKGHDSVVQLLLDLGGANPDPDPIPLMDTDSSTPMLAAIGGPSLRVVELLAVHERFDPTKRFDGKNYCEIALRRQGTHWREEFDILTNASDQYQQVRARTSRPN